MKEKLILELLEVVKSTKAFVLDQAPEVLQQMLIQGRIMSALGLVGGVAALLAAFYICRALIKSEPETAPIGLLPAAAGLVAFFVSVKPFVTSWFAPKVFLIERLMELLK